MNGGRTVTANPRNGQPGCESWPSTALVPRALNTLGAATPYSWRVAFRFVNTRTRTTSSELRSKSSHRRSAFLAAEAAPAMNSGRRRGNREDTRDSAQRPRPTLTRLGMITLSKNRTERLAIGRRRSEEGEGKKLMSTPITAAAGGFFAQLMPLLTDRTLMVIVSKSDDQHLTLSVVPKRMKEGENAALTTPLCCTGTAEELDRDLPTHLRDFVSGHVTLSNNLAQIQRDREEAEKAAREELNKKRKSG